MNRRAFLKRVFAVASVCALAATVSVQPQDEMELVVGEVEELKRVYTLADAFILITSDSDSLSDLGRHTHSLPGYSLASDLMG